MSDAPDFEVTMENGDLVLRVKKQDIERCISAAVRLYAEELKQTYMLLDYEKFLKFVAARLATKNPDIELRFWRAEIAEAVESALRTSLSEAQDKDGVVNGHEPGPSERQLECDF